MVIGKLGMQNVAFSGVFQVFMMDVPYDCTYNIYIYKTLDTPSVAIMLGSKLT